MINKLKYVLPIANNTSTLNALQSFRFTSNGYDVDAALASTAMAGFGEWAAMYSRARTLWMKYNFTITNSDTGGCALFGGFIPGVSLGSTSVGDNYTENRHWKRKAVGNGMGVSTKSVSGFATVEGVFGNKGVLTDDTFQYSTSSSTLATTSTMVLYAGTAKPLLPVAGFTIQGTIELCIKFERKVALLGEVEGEAHMKRLRDDRANRYYRRLS